ncbi:MAG TPA: CHC2 zinc finger domain-containing protein [Bacteroidales bacterium]|nr:CHC2 zinc finger domain-containing protein [Bacteroidales bacterium]
MKKKELLDIIDELAVFTFYMGFKPLINQTYISPLREDKSPSFCLFWGKNGHLLYKDFGTGESGDCVKFVKEIKHVSYKTAIKEIYDLFKHKSINSYQKSKPLRKITPSPKRIEVRKTNFTKEGLSFWKKYGVIEKTLNKFDIIQVDKVWSNDKLIVTKYNTKGPIFAYIIYDRIKIYMPYNSTKFLTNCNQFYIQGWKQLDRNKKDLIITKSLKDVCVLDVLEYSSIAPNSESYSIPGIIHTSIKNSFDNIYLLYDNDKTGIKNSNKLTEKFNYTPIFIPDKFKTKDISDFYKQYGESETIKLLQKLIPNESFEQRL